MKRVTRAKAKAISKNEAEEVMFQPEKEEYTNFQPQYMQKPRSSLINYALVIILVGAAYYIGVVTTKLQYLQSNGIQNTQTAQAPVTPGQQLPARTAFINYAKQLNLDTNTFSTCLDSHKHKNDVATDIADGQKLGVNGTPSFYINGLGLVGAYPYSAFKTVIDHELAGSTDPIPSTIPIQPKVDVAMGSLPILGNQNAPVTIVEFSDFQCPFCERFYSQTFSQLKKDYIDTGKVKLAYRLFPLTQIHPNAQGSAEAAACANDQGKFWEMHNLFFQNQNTWSNDTPIAGA